MIFCQLDYTVELGIGTGATIAEYGCAEVSVASLLANCFGKQVDPLLLNQQLINVGGYASNGTTAMDIIRWDYINRIFPDVSLLFNIAYYNPPLGQGLPADLNVLDNQLNKGISVIVGVSFNHHASEEVPTHYVEIYKKNADGTYQCRDPWFRGEEADIVFDYRYAVNGMSVANCILQMISYNGPVITQETALFSPGQTITVNRPVVVGQAPGLQNAAYGQITPTAPATVIAIFNDGEKLWYNIDQSAIGGGTGYALVKDVDEAHNAVVEQPKVAMPASTPVEQVATPVQETEAIPVSPAASETTTPFTSDGNQKVVEDAVAALPVKTPVPDMTELPTSPETMGKLKDLVKQLEIERNNAISKAKVIADKYEEDFKHFTALQAAGYGTLEEVEKVIGGVKNELSKHRKQLVQVLKSNEDMGNIFAEKCKEDFSAIEMGDKALSALDTLKKEFTMIAESHRTKPTLTAILVAWDTMLNKYEVLKRQVGSLQTKKSVETIEKEVVSKVKTVPSFTNSNILWMKSVFGFGKGGE